MTDFTAITLEIGKASTSNASYGGDKTGNSATTITGGWWLSKTLTDTAAVWDLNVELDISWDVNWRDGGNNQPDRVDLTWGIIPMDSVTVGEDGTVTQMPGSVWEKVTMGSTVSSNSLQFGVLTLDASTISVDGSGEDLTAKLTTDDAVAGWSVTSAQQKTNRAKDGKKTYDYFTGMSGAASRPLIPTGTEVSDLTIEDGSYLWCVDLSLTRGTDSIRTLSGCDQFDILSSCIREGHAEGVMKGICDLVGTGSGKSSTGYVLPVQKEVTEAGASTLLYGAAMVLITTMLAF